MPIRTWLHATDTASAIIKIIESGVQNDIFNISGNFELANIVVVRKILELVHGTSNNINDHVTHIKRAGADMRYSIDDTKLKSLGWAPQADFDQELANVVEYYRNNFLW
jgi:dTDP-D-glucose 4,6-dehydratase